MTTHPVVSRNDWLAARKVLLAQEKALTQARDALNAARRALPWVKVEKRYVFATPAGPSTLAELFEDRSQLIVKHFMLAPGQGAGCIGCSFECDHIDGALVHLRQRDVRFVAVARAPLAEIEAYRRRMGWHFAWVSSFGSDFNYDFHVSFRPEDLARGQVEYNYERQKIGMEDLSAISVFCKDERGDVFHSYSAYGRGAEEILGTYMLLDLTPKGRDENGPHFDMMDWVKRHDEYADSAGPACCGAGGPA